MITRITSGFTWVFGNGTRRFVGVVGVVAAVMLFTPFAWGQPVSVPNPSFEVGVDGPEGWRHIDGETEWAREGSDGERSIAVFGDGTTPAPNAWVSDSINFKPHTTYRLQLDSRHREGLIGVLFTGTPFHNTTLAFLGRNWQRFVTHFMTPAAIPAGQSYLRFGQYNARGMTLFDNVNLSEAVPVYRRQGGVALGEGERIEGASYTFDAPFLGDSGNHARPLHSFNCNFNWPRFTFSAGDWVVYRHEIGAVQQLSGEVAISLKYHSNGVLCIEASTDGAAWIPVGSMSGVGDESFSVPESLFPAEAVWIRLRDDETTGGLENVFGAGLFQVHGYRYNATLDHPPGDLAGMTHFAVVKEDDGRVGVSLEDLGDAVPGENVLRMQFANQTGEELSLSASVTAEVSGGFCSQSSPGSVVLAPGNTEDVAIAYEIPAAGDNTKITVAVTGSARYRSEISFCAPSLFAQHYGALLPDSSEAVGLWWASSGWKVGRDRRLPSATASAMRVQTARNEREATQFVLRPAEGLQGLRVTPRALTTTAGDQLPAEHIEILHVGYVPIAQCTDYVGVIGDWPDPLLPLDGPVDLAAGKNQPFWVRVYVPKDAAAGVYSGEIELKAAGWEGAVPLEVEVFDFTLPDRMTCQAALGFDPTCTVIDSYHGATAKEDREVLAQLYLREFSEHHISPYENDNRLLYPRLEYTWPNVPADGGEVPEEELEEVFRPEFNWDTWDPEMTRIIDTYHFNAFRLFAPGLGAGEAWSSNLLTHYGEDTPEFKTAFKAWYSAVQEHFRKKGWLDKAFIYWFDEPTAEQYEFCIKYNLMMKEAAPDLQRMLTEQVEPELIGGPNLWCPVSHYYNHEAAEPRRLAGDRFWWYVCSTPMAPYATLFIDHPATEMRVWLWQTWQRKINGLLIWDTIWWTSNAAYPDRLQNPYEDPMNWCPIMEGSVGVGDKIAWGNGGGLLLYPPLAAVDGSHGFPILDPPVTSLRMEMLRDGIEDYEYLTILRDLIAEMEAQGGETDLAVYRDLLEVPGSITASMMEITWEPAPIESHREAVARAIVELQRPAAE